MGGESLMEKVAFAERPKRGQSHQRLRKSTPSRGDSKDRALRPWHGWPGRRGARSPVYLWSGERKGKGREQKIREALGGREHAGSRGTPLGIQLLL